MSEGETLPPLIAVIEGDDSSLLEMFARDIDGVRAFAAQFQDVLAEAMGGVSLEAPTLSADGIAAAGEQAGALLAEGTTEGFTSNLDLGTDITGSIKSGDVLGAASDAGSMAAAAFDEGASGIGEGLGEKVAAELASSLPDRLAQVGAEAMEGISTGASAALSSAQIGAQIGKSIGTANFIDSAVEAGDEVGTEFARAFGDGAASTIPKELGKFGDALADEALELGDKAGRAAGAKMSSSLGMSVDATVAETFERMAGAATEAAEAFGRFGTVVQSTQAQVSVVGEVVATQAAQITDGVQGAVESAGAIVLRQTAEIVPQVGAAGAQAGAAYGAGLQSQIEARIAVLTAQGLTRDLAAKIAESVVGDPMVPDPTGPGFTRQSKIVQAQVLAQAQAAADAAKEIAVALDQELAAQIETDSALIEAATRAGIAEPMLNAIMDVRAGMVADVAGLPEELRPALALIEQVFATNGTEAGTAWVTGLLEEVANARIQVPGVTAGASELAEGGAQDAQAFIGGFSYELEALTPTLLSRVATTFGAVVMDLARWSEAVMMVLAEGTQLPLLAENIGRAMGLIDDQIENDTVYTTTMLGELWSAGMDRVAEIVQSGTATIAGAYQSAASAVQSASSAITDAQIEIGFRLEAAAAAVNEFTGDLAGDAGEAVLGFGSRITAGVGSIVTGLGERIAGIPLVELIRAEWEATAPALDATAAEMGAEAGESFRAAEAAAAAGPIPGTPAQGPVVASPTVMSSKEFNAEDDTAGAASIEAMGGAAEKASGEVGGLASIMYGPLGMAVFMGMSIIPQLSGVLGGLFDSTRAVTLSQSDLANSITSAGGAAGDSVASYVASQAQASGLAASASQAGVSLATWTEAVLGNKSAQEQVTSSVDALNQSQVQQQLTTQSNADVTGKFSGELQGAQVQADQNSVTTNKLTDSNQQLLASMHAQAAQITEGITKQTQLSQATLQLSQNTGIFDATLQGLNAQLQTQAFTSAETSVAALNLGTSNSTLNLSLTNSEQAYTLAQDGANAYAQALTTANGDASTLLGTQASFTIALGGLSTNVSTYGTSLDVSNTKGAQNIETITNIAAAADKSAAAVYQNEVQTKGATQAYQDANTLLTQEKDAFIAAGDKAGYNKGMVQQLANELFQLPSNIPVNIAVSLTGAGASLLSGGGSVAKLLDASITVPHRAEGGPVGAGDFAVVGERGPELVQFGAPGFVYPTGSVPRVEPGYGVGSGATAGGGVTYIVQQFIAGSVLAQDDLVHATQSGMVAVGSRNPSTYTTYQSARGRSS